MKQPRTETPFSFLQDFKGKFFAGEWPTLPEMFRITAARFPDRPCFTEFLPERNTLTYSQVLRNTEKLADWMLSAGIKKGDRIAVSGKNSPEWGTVYLAALTAGGIIVPIDYALHDNEIENLLRAAEPKLFFVDEEKFEYFSEKSNIASFDMQVYSLNKKYPERYVYLLETEQSPAAVTASEQDVAAILFTSGTTGTPKGVMLTHRNLVSDCYIAQTNLAIYCTDVFYALLPIHHAYTMLAVFLESLSVGAEIVFGKSMAVSSMLRELKDGKITMLLGVPLLFNKLLAGILKGIRAKGAAVYGLMKMLMAISYFVKKIFGVNPGRILFKSVLNKASLGSLRIAICGGGPLAPSVFRVYNEMGIDFIQGYGLTETSPIIALNPKEHFKIKSVGRYFAPYMEMRIADADENGVGEIQVKGPMVMLGYYNMPEETAAVFTEDGWFKTGDLGKLDNENFLYLAGRAKNMIVTSGGKNVFPEEIENAFQLYDDIEQITVQGFIMDEQTKSEGIEALVYPSDSLLKKLGVVRGAAESEAAVRTAVENIVNKVNKAAQPYARIGKITLLKAPLEMTTTKKVKRQYKK
ncbi:MAG: AMP-binding protein [Bacteroides sp.]|nr:AMP-binding protein [Prevotella sp.]MCM1408073.1 AMP-binding protein [Treponema brennaborense]MCM1469049.1 AMP-binding protein [Bacteroides sp.]